MQLISPAATGLSCPLSLLRLELDINNHPVSLIGERIDVAIRITDNPEAGAIARRLGVCRSLLCAAPVLDAPAWPVDDARRSATT